MKYLPGSHDSSNTDVTTNDAVSEKKPGGDESIIARISYEPAFLRLKLPGSRSLVHDVEIWRVEGESSSGKT